MSSAETIDRLTDIIASQAAIIRELYGVVAQLNATTSLDERIAAIQEEAAQHTDGPEE